ncbi:hypothetical protein QJS66_18710 [Kocuria rhizophila]|nr:hypothetical protein QJS66_18710 [Kocuria rhizophila]
MRAAEHVKAQLTGLARSNPCCRIRAERSLRQRPRERVRGDLEGIQRVTSPFTSEAQLRALAVRLVTAAAAAG